MNDSKKCCGCPCHKALGMFLLLAGLVFLLGALNVITPHLVSLAWPVLVMLIGAKLMCKGFCKCCGDA